jgi:5'-3' exonuclease
MGIKDLCQFIKKTCPSVFINLPINSLSGQRIAVDASVYLYKFICIDNQHKGNWIDMFIHMIIWLRYNNIRPIFVFDGKPPKEKETTQKDRRENRAKLKWLIEELNELIEIISLEGVINKDVQCRLDKILNFPFKNWSVDQVLCELNNMYKRENGKFINIGTEHVNKLKELLSCWGNPWFQATGEAEKTCAWLCKWGWVKGVLTTDSDVLVYGTPVFIKDLRINEAVCKVVRYEDVIDMMDLTPEQFTDFCIMCGSDYNNRIQGIGPNTAYDLICKYKKLENIENVKDTSVLSFRTVRDLFKLPEKDEVSKVIVLESYENFRIPYFKEPNDGSLIMFLFKNNSRFNIDDLKIKYEPEFILV